MGTHGRGVLCVLLQRFQLEIFVCLVSIPFQRTVFCRTYNLNCCYKYVRIYIIYIIYMYKVLPKNSRHLNVAREPVLVRTIGARYRCIYPFLNQCATWLRAECTHSFDLRLCITSCLCRTHIYQTSQRHIPEDVSVSSFSKLFL